VTSNATNGSSANKKTQELIKQMREDGLELKKSAASTQQQISFNVSNQINYVIFPVIIYII